MLAHALVVHCRHTSASNRPIASQKGGRHKGVEESGERDDNIAAVIFVNDVDEGRFREIDQIGGER